MSPDRPRCRVRRRARLFLLGSLIALLLACDGAEPSRTATEVIDFIPDAAPAHIVRQGHCTGPSRVLPAREDAWRCIDDERVADPCFLVDQVITCGVNPVSADGGYQLQLTMPLPPRTSAPAEPSRPWLLELDDGALCGVALDAAGEVDGKPVTYRCGGGDVLLGAIRPGQPLTALRLTGQQLHSSDASLDDASEAAIRRAWQ